MTNNQKSPNELLGLRSIAQMSKKRIGEKIKHNLGSAWYFDTWYDKLILVGLGILGMWKIVEFF